MCLFPANPTSGKIDHLPLLVEILVVIPLPLIKRNAMFYKPPSQFRELNIIMGPVNECFNALVKIEL